MRVGVYQYVDDAWRLVHGADNRTPPTGGGLYVDPDAVAGSVPVGSASYPVPLGALFVDPVSGVNSTSGGAIGAPLRTFEYACSRVTTGGTIVLRGGEYHEGRVYTSAASNGYAGVVLGQADVTVQNYPNEAAWFVGSTRVTSWASGAGYWSTAFATSLNRSQTFSFNATGIFVGAQNPYAANAEQVWFDGDPLQYVDTLAQVGPGKFYVAGSLAGDGFTFNATTYYIGDDPAGHEVRIGDLQTSISLGATGCLARGIGVKQYCPSVAHQGALKSYRTGAGFENVVVQDCLGVGLSQIGSGTAAAPTGTDQFLRNVTVDRCGLMGIHANQANNLTHYRVRSQRCDWRMFNRAPASGNCKITRQRGFTAIESVYSDSYSHGLWMDEMVVGVDIVSCTISRNATIGLISELGGNFRAVNCVITGNGDSGVLIPCNTGIALWNNTITRNGLSRYQTINGTYINLPNDIRVTADTRIPVSGSTTTRDARYPIPDPDGITWEITSLVIKNNVMSGSGMAGLWWIDDLRRNNGTAKSWTTMGLDVRSNFYETFTTPSGHQYMVSNTGSANGTPYDSLSAIKSGTGLESGSIQASGIITAAGLLDETYRSTYDAAAVPLPAAIANLVGRPTGEQRAGAWR